MPRFVFGLIFVVFLIVGDVSAAVGGPIDYVYFTKGSFGTMDLQSGAFTPIGPGGANDQDMASRPGGPLYAADLSTRLLTNDVNTGAIGSIIGTMGNDIHGLRFNRAGPCLDSAIPICTQ